MRLTNYAASLQRHKTEYACALLRMLLDTFATIDDMTPAVAAEGLAHTNRLIRLAYALRGQYEEALMAAMLTDGHETITTPSATITVENTDTHKQWDRETLLDDFATQITEQVIAGARTTMSPAQVRHVVDRTIHSLTTVARPDWRVRALRDAGLNPDDYSTTTRKPPRLAITPRRGNITHVQAPRLADRTRTRASLWN